VSKISTIHPTILAFHGSPGVPADFEPLRAALAVIAPEIRWIAEPRPGYPGSAESSESLSSAGPASQIVLGYSWGCFDCLEYVAKSPDSVRAVILIAPYLYPDGKAGFLKRSILRAPLLGDAILRKAAPKAVEGLLVKSSHPRPVPESYRLSALAYLEPSILRVAALEKDGKGPRLARALTSITESRIPVTVIRGAEDQTSDHHSQLGPLRKVFASVVFEKIADAGHALLWTHPGTLADVISKSLKSESL
jgi:pimeloyl-ACP methyl ester carboxylesterase